MASGTATMPVSGVGAARHELVGSSEPVAPPPASTRYSTVAIVLHWSLAAILLAQVLLGWRLDDVDDAERSVLLGIHKSIGIAILVLSVVRLGWRIGHRPPPDDPSLTRIESAASHWVHRGFYVCMLLLPLTGWAMVSAGRNGAMRVFGGLPWPRFPMIGLLPASAQEAAAGTLDTSHGALAWVMVGLFALHVAGAMKHHFLSQDAVLARMVPGVRTGVFTDPRLLTIAGVALVAAALAYYADPPAAAKRPKPRSAASADIFLDVVQPALVQRCASCHNDDLARGGLSVASYQAILEGGRHGGGIVPRVPGRSEILRRVTLPTGHKLYMPRDDRAPLGQAQIEALRWWITIGAPASGAVGTFKPSSEALAMLAEALGRSNTSPGQELATETLPTVDPGPPDSIAALVGAGFTVRPVSKNSNLLSVNLYQVRNLTGADLDALGKLRDQIVELSLPRAGVTDANLATIGTMINLRSLRLDANPLTDAGMARLAPLKALRTVNLYGTRITGPGLRMLTAMPGVQRLYVWGTPVTDADVAAAVHARPGLSIVGGTAAAATGAEAKGGPQRE